VTRSINPDNPSCGGDVFTLLLVASVKQCRAVCDSVLPITGEENSFKTPPARVYHSDRCQRFLRQRPQKGTVGKEIIGALNLCPLTFVTVFGMGRNHKKRKGRHRKSVVKFHSLDFVA
jgi:hypothetical protein